MRQDLIKGLEVGMFTLVGSLASLAFAWYKDRDELTQRTKVLDEAIKRVAFWASWLQALKDHEMSEDLRPSRYKANLHFQQASDDVVALYLKQQQQERQRQVPIDSVRSSTQTGQNLKKIFLWYPPRLRRAWVSRVAFYLSLCCMIYVGFGYWIQYFAITREAPANIAKAVADGSDPRPLYEMKQQIERLAFPIYLGVMTAISLLAIAFRQISLRVEKSMV